MNIINFQAWNIPAAGFTQTIDVTDTTVQEYLLTSTGAVTLEGSVTITPTGTPVVSSEILFKYEAKLTLGSNNLTIFGRVLNQQEALSKCVITCRWDDVGSVWVVDVEMSDNGQYVGKVMGDSLDGSPDYLTNKVLDSLIEDPTSHKIKLDGDVASPSNGYHYGKEGGAKGWFANYVPLLPVGTLIYLGSFAQTGTNDPVPTTLVNTLGVTVAGTYVGVGIYTVNIPVVPDLTKVIPLTGNGFNDSNFMKVNVVAPGGIPKIVINTYDKSGTLTDGLLDNMPLLILILP